MSSRFYRSFEEFAREEIRPLTRAGWSMDELDIDTGLGSEDLDFGNGKDNEEDEE
ncbi:MAG: hypothetical protein HY909_09490 [Deltaproteobacteria bacterium]|jgi:hypothetical protein|nr:hypothetical protein [Deltaproteobacteria bacterium]